MLAWLFRLAVLAVLVWFAVKNGQEVELFLLPGQSWKSPLIFVVLVAFVTGVLIGLTAWLPTVVRQRRELGRLRKLPPPAVPPGPAAQPAITAPGNSQDIHGV
jgi:lipopolysaccharide assembly protein A